jgi:glucose-6-phosphate isomerase
MAAMAGGKPGRGECWEQPCWRELEELAGRIKREGPHLRELLKSPERHEQFSAEFDGVLLDYSRAKLTEEARRKLFELAHYVELGNKIKTMAEGKVVNKTEKRAVLHMALRAAKGDQIMCGGEDVVKEVHVVLDRVWAFSDAVRSGAHLGATGSKIDLVISIGIGGSYLGPEFVFEALRTDAAAARAAEGRQLRFLANVDPVDVARALHGVALERTLVVIVSKTFTTAETMLNARTLKRALLECAKAHGVRGEDMIAKHMIAVSANVPAAEKFGIRAQNVFGFWDWVGGRYSVCSAVGVVPLALQYGKAVVRDFLSGAREMDEHFCSAPYENNLPVILGLLGVWNASFLGYSVRALLPYSQALLRFPAHIQQVDMESNGKRVTLEGKPLPIEAGEFNFGEPGTNGQHSFYQLLHQGRVCPCDFIGSIRSQQPISAAPRDEEISNHDELMCNFFAQPDALACGKTAADLVAENVPPELRTHKEFPGDRPSTVILFECFDARRIGQLLALYEHRSAVQGFIWNINSFDQWGVELGKSLANNVRNSIKAARAKGELEVRGHNASTTALLQRYLGEDME